MGTYYAVAIVTTHSFIQYQMSSPLVIREAVQSDAESIHTIHCACIRELCSMSYSQHQLDPWLQRSTPERFTKFITQEDTVFLVIETSESHKVIGFAHMGKCNDTRFLAWLTTKHSVSILVHLRAERVWAGGFWVRWNVGQWS